MSQYAADRPAPTAWPASPPGYGHHLPSAPPPDPLPATGTDYHQFFRTGRNRWWKGALVIVLLVVGFFVIAAALGFAAVAVDLATGRVSGEQLSRGEIVITPLVLLATNLGLAALIPLSMLLQWGFYGQPIRWMHSVRGYVRWDLLRQMAVLIVPVFVLYVLASIFLFPAPPSGPFTAESVGLLVVVLLTTPLQAAGEEYGARGLITRAAGGWVADPIVSLIVSTVVSATLFMLAHGAGDPWLIFYYFFFGVAMSVIVWRTGGLEVAVLIHTANNLLLFVVAILAGQDLAAGLDRSDGAGGPWVLVPMALVAGITALVWWRARRTAVSRGYSGPDRPLP